MELPRTRLLSLRRAGARLFVTLDDARTRNALSDTMVAELEQVLCAVRDDRSLRVIVIQGAGGYFCAGGDLKGAHTTSASAPGEPDPVLEASRRGGRLFAALNRQLQVIVVVVEGAALGGGFGLVCCADVVITTARASFGLSETSLGLVPAQIAPYVVSRLGLSQARCLALTGARFDGVTAAAIGLSNHHCSSSDAAAQVLDQVLSDVGRCGPHANAATKALLLDAAGIDRPEAIERAAEVFATCLRSAEGREGIAAFVEKRLPHWAEVP